jgi:hypothetical protein
MKCKCCFSLPLLRLLPLAACRLLRQCATLDATSADVDAAPSSPFVESAQHRSTRCALAWQAEFLLTLAAFVLALCGMVPPGLASLPTLDKYSDGGRSREVGGLRARMKRAWARAYVQIFSVTDTFNPSVHAFDYSELMHVIAACA